MLVAKSQQLISIGDLNSWRKRYRITSATRPDALLALMQGDLATEGWQPDAAEGGHAWRKRIGDRTARLTFATQSASDDVGYIVETAIRID